jgi:mannose-6-phosphate isomerase-like protein (cupin superfamily)
MILDHTNSESKKIHINQGILKPGAKLSVSAHGTPEQNYDETYIIQQGYCDLDLDGEIINLEPGDIVFIPGGTPHGLDNSEGSEDVVILAIWAGVPPEGVNGVYDQRLKAWGKSFKLIGE